MSGMQRLRAVLALLLALLTPPGVLCAATVLTAQGTAAIEGGNIAQSEKNAIQDAYYKAVTQEALRTTPQSSALTVLKKLPALLASRGMQDVTQYKIIARAPQAAVLFLTVEFRINDAFLRDWIAAQKLDVVPVLRPRILVAVSSNAPAEGLHEWWYLKGKKGYSLFESMLAADLAQWGENVFQEAPNIGVLASGADPFLLASRFGASLLLHGTLRYTPLSAGLYQCTLSLNLSDVTSHAKLGAWTLTRKGDMPAADLYAGMIGAISEDVRARIAPRIVKLPPVAAARQVCIENIRDHATYQKILDVLTGLEGVEGIEPNRIAGHSICHTIRLKGRLEDTMQALQTRQAADVDIQVKDETAHIVINQ